MKPPPQLDGADVVFWAWSSPEPFFEMPVVPGPESISIHGLAICRYAHNGTIYRFSCNANWEVENDSPSDDVKNPLRAASAQFDAEAVEWHAMADDGRAVEKEAGETLAPKAALPVEGTLENTLGQLVRAGRDLEAIVMLRTEKGLSLFEAQQYVSRLKQKARG